MRHVLVLFAMMFSLTAFAQFEIGVKAGLSSLELADESIILPGDAENFTISVAEANYGYHFGLYTRLSLANIFIEPSFLFNSSTVDYNVREHLFDTGVINTIRSESYNNLDIPLLVGMKIGFLRIQGGPVAHIYLNSTSELTAIDGYGQKFNDATYGMQGGLGLDILKFRFDINYETNLSTFGDHMTIGGQEFSFDERPARIVASIGMKF